jgi:ribosomal protein S8
MRIEELKSYTMYLMPEEFELMYSITKSIPYGYRVVNDEYLITATEDMINDIQNALEHEGYIQRYEECNRYKADRIADLMININYEMKYNM